MNRVILIGCVGQNPTVTESYASFSLATDEGKDKDGQKRTEWHRIKAFKNLGVIRDFVKKGSRIGIWGHLMTSEYNGKKYTDVVADNVELLGKTETASKTFGDEQPDGLDLPPFKEDDIPF